MTTLPPPNIVRTAYSELIVTDLEHARWFYLDMLGFVLTAEDDDALYLRGYEETVHHSLVLRLGSEPANACVGFRVWAAHDLDLAAAWYDALGCRVERRAAGATRGIGEAVRVEDPLGFTLEFFHATERQQRMIQRYDLQHGARIARVDHVNFCVDDVAAAHDLYSNLGFVTSETIEGDDRLFGAWMHRKPSVHDVAFTGGVSPRVHHMAFVVPETHHILDLCDHFGSLDQQHHLERGPGRHGVSNAFYLYLRDNDKHRIEVYTSDYYTGDPDQEVIRWSVNDMRRRDFWGAAVVPSWYAESTTVLDLDGKAVEVRTVDESQSEAKVGADGFR
ncbi:MAG: 3,4-dihydroxyphenylacetate 2,3-dioxygenase [Acidimicrobiales bacterium]|nr:3,4-dihydroxyphenylacetate 2,3-dioxygenase [Acidimicrobiales bacterium]